MFSSLKKLFQTITAQLGQKLQLLFKKESIDPETLADLEKILIEADTGVKTSRKISKTLTQKVHNGSLKKGSDLHVALKQELRHILSGAPYSSNASIFLLVGINGSGKTTFAAKLAYYFKSQHKKVLLVAADTFRAAATDQLVEWGKKFGIDVATGKPNQDPSAVIYAGCAEFIQGKYDILIIDTAGRVQTKVNLMKELTKMKASISKNLPDQPVCTLLVLDSMLGQNSFDQAKLFQESIPLTGIVLTKMDGTAKGESFFP